MWWGPDTRCLYTVVTPTPTDPFPPAFFSVFYGRQEFFGTRWCEIAKFLPGRTENAVKNRYNSSARFKWAESRSKAGGGGAATRKAASRAFIERLKSTLEKTPIGCGGGGETSGPSNNKVHFRTPLLGCPILHIFLSRSEFPPHVS